jgi:glycosylphosphatidylinositol transamidase (GPIT) subunit GPI8
MTHIYDIYSSWDCGGIRAHAILMVAKDEEQRNNRTLFTGYENYILF